MAHGQSRRLTSVGAWTHRHAGIVLLGWVVLAVALNIAIPQLEHTVARHSADFLPRDVPANISLEKMARDFEVAPSNAVSSVVLVDENGFGPPS